jgi:hypothetical protein
VKLLSVGSRHPFLARNVFYENREFGCLVFAGCNGDRELRQVRDGQKRQTDCELSLFHDFNSPFYG